MTNTTAIQALIDAVEAGGVTEWPTLSELGIPADFGDGTPIIRSIMRAYGGSLDAAMALHKAVLPGWEFFISKEGKENEFVASILNPCWTLGHSALSSNPARAWLLAILRAMLTQK